MATKRFELALGEVISTLKRFFPLLGLAAGALLLLFGFVYDVLFAGIPYQDPTPELAASYAWHAKVAIAIRRSGLGLGMLGVIGMLWQRWRAR